MSGERTHATGTTVELDVRGSKEVCDLPGGPLAIALGGEARRERLDNQFASFITSGDVLGSGVAAQPVAASRNVEVAVRRRQRADRQGRRGAARRALRPLQRFRRHDQSQGRAALAAAADAAAAKLVGHRISRAAALRRLHAAAAHFTIDFARRTIRCAARSPGSPQDCDVFFRTASGGNPDLQPETSEQFNAGVVWEPVNGLSLAVDYWKINKNNYIGTLSADTIFAQLRVLRADQHRPRPGRSAYPNLPGPDRDGPAAEPEPRPRAHVGLRRRRELARTGRPRSAASSFGLNGTYISDWKIQPEGLTYVSGVGRTADVAGPFPRWRHYASLTGITVPGGRRSRRRINPATRTRTTSDPPRAATKRLALTTSGTSGPLRGIQEHDDRRRHQEPDGPRAAVYQCGVRQGGDPFYADPRGRDVLRAADVRVQIGRAIAGARRQRLKSAAGSGLAMRVDARGDDDTLGRRRRNAHSSLVRACPRHRIQAPPGPGRADRK